jgi:hypothetical protein
MPPVWIARPPKPVSEMTDEELEQWADAVIAATQEPTGDTDQSD